MPGIIGKTILGQYQVEEFIASGGMGAVYRVWDLKRNVPLAMKVLHTNLAANPSIYKRFKREANALKKLTHPNIVPFYGLYQSDDFDFILEAYIDGPTLRGQMKARERRPLALDDVLIYLKALAAAIGYAHVRGVVHCDIKPGNVMLDRGGAVFLTDFGIARHAESTTTTFATAGTPAYMAPEQIRGEQVTPATDVYALGVMLFEMLTGRRPFRGDEKGTTSAGPTANERTRYAHLHLPPPDPRRLNMAIPEALSQVVLKALAKEPAARYLSVQALFAACCEALHVLPENVPERIRLDGETAAVPPPPLPRGADGWLQRFFSERRNIYTAGAVAAVLVLAAGGILWSRSRARPPATPDESSSLVLTANPSTGTQPSEETEVVVLTLPVTPTDKTLVATPTNPSPTPAAALQVNPQDGAEVVRIPAGEFSMGSNKNSDPYFYGAEAPVHQVTLDEYWIYRTEVTNAMYQRCVAQQKCPRPADPGSATRKEYFENPLYAAYPVVNVSWKSADAYCKWAGGRLPTEAEWEKAGRGDDGRLYPWGNQQPTRARANFNAADTMAVGSFPAGASPYGVLDMAGNVIEWVNDYFSATYYSASPDENPRGPSSGSRRVYRSGAYHNDAGAIRVVMRGSKGATHANVDIGFRCALDAAPEAQSTPEPESGEPAGRIVFTCQVTGGAKENQICMIHADGSGWQQLTHETNADHFFPSWAPDGGSIVYVSNRSGEYEIYEMDLSGGGPYKGRQLTAGLGTLNAPAISPDGEKIIFTNKSGGNSLWIMQRDGSGARQLYGQPQGYGWDPVWSPDGKQILFGSGTTIKRNLSIIDADGGNLRLVTDAGELRGRSDWSPQGVIATYIGPVWQHEIWLMNPDGSQMQQITDGGNNNAPSFSPDGNWLTFTSYRDAYGDDNGCEIYIMRIDGSDARRLTANQYCDWQPRWGR